MSSSTLPKEMKALVIEDASESPAVRLLPTPRATVGSAVVRILAVSVLSYAREVYGGKRNYPFPTPLVPGGCGAIGRVVEVGPDATKLKPDDLVFVDCFVHSRDDPSECFLAGLHQGHTAGSKKLMAALYREWTYAEYCRTPLECLTVLNEPRLLDKYKIEDLVYGGTMLVAFGGLVDIQIKPGETLIVAPATGSFTGAAVLIALAMGAKVIAMGRNTAALQKLKEIAPDSHRLETVPITGSMEHDRDELKKHGPADAYLDLGPTGAHASTHIQSCIYALKHGARVSLMGGYKEDVAIPHSFVMHFNIRLYGKWMYERADVAALFKMVENGVLRLGDHGGCRTIGTFPLDQWKDAWDAAADAEVGEQAVILP